MRYRGFIFNLSVCQPAFDEFYKSQKESLPNQKTSDLPKRNANREETGRSRKVFVVHGHDNELKEKVARLLETLDLQPVILHEQPNKGSTIIEKFEKYADVKFAVVLLTPDDEGRTKNSKTLNSRARQNVVFEHGFFSGKLGREYVCAIYKGVERPSDLDGLLYVKYDEDGSWRYRLADEIKAAGIDVDKNRIKGH